MKKQALINLIKRKLSKDYGTLTEAAKHLGVTRENLSRAANGVTETIPDYLLEYVGYEKKEIEYKKSGE